MVVDVDVVLNLTMKLAIVSTDMMWYASNVVNSVFVMQVFDVDYRFVKLCSLSNYKFNVRR